LFSLIKWLFMGSTDPKYKEAVLKAIAYHFPEAKVILFGSRARGTNLPGADIDIAIDTGSPIMPRDVTRIKATLENLPIPVEVDLVDLNLAPQELKDIIKREGIIWKN
jgi:uncharacterized protein